MAYEALSTDGGNFRTLRANVFQELLDEVRGLQNLAYQLGLEETREMTRGKYLNVLTPRPRISRRREDRR
ncbi:unnamed protein product [Cyprideis torosa]|uniref:Uncharacterized protein n=1 Tax=Cyprideis torosa TaxID=163714 RepID=A0A7R8ZWJ3_9CRUS|nr:unnamed protein product [Cyprideis torosa]CAG0905367.1 unnamed protein product [Cyprideis torosa]